MILDIGQQVQFKHDSDGRIYYRDTVFTIALIVDEENGYVLESDFHQGIVALYEEVEPIIVLQTEKQESFFSRGSAFFEGGGDAVFRVISSLPVRLDSASEVCISSASDAAASVSEAFGSCLSAVGDTISSSADAVGDIFGSIDL